MSRPVLARVSPVYVDDVLAAAAASAQRLRALASEPMDDALDGAGVERLLAAAASDPAERPAFFDALLESDVLVLGTMGSRPVDGIAQPGSSMQLAKFSDEDGDLVPFFSSEEMLRRTVAAHPSTEPRYLRFRCRDLFDMTRGSRLVLNPDAPYGKVFLPAEVEALVEGQEPGLSTEVITEARTIMVGAAAYVPDALPATLARFFVQRPSVLAAQPRLGRTSRWTQGLPDGRCRPGPR
jgi:SseB protein N-terminal domain